MSGSGRSGGAPPPSSSSRSGSSLDRPRSLFDIEGDRAAFAGGIRSSTPGLADRLPPLSRAASPSPFGHRQREASEFGNLGRGSQTHPQRNRGDFRPFGPVPSLSSTLQGGDGPTLPALAISNIPFPQGRGRGRGRGQSPSLPRLSDLNLGDLDMSMPPSTQTSLFSPPPDLAQGGLPSLRRRPSFLGLEHPPESFGFDASFPVGSTLTPSSSTTLRRGVALPALRDSLSLQSGEDPFHRPPLPSPFQPPRPLRRRPSGQLSLSEDAMESDTGFGDFPTARSGRDRTFRDDPQIGQPRRSASPAGHEAPSLLDPPTFGYPAEGGYQDPYDFVGLAYPSSLPPRASSPQLRGSSNMLTDLPDLSSLPPLPLTAPVNSASHPGLARYASFTDFRTPLAGGSTGLPRGESTGSVASSNSSSGSGSTSSQYTCRDCGTVWARKADFDRHVRTHTGEKPFQCDLCDKGYARKDALQRHQRTVHASTLQATRYPG